MDHFVSYHGSMPYVFAMRSSSSGLLDKIHEFEDRGTFCRMLDEAVCERRVSVCACWETKVSTEVQSVDKLSHFPDVCPSVLVDKVKKLLSESGRTLTHLMYAGFYMRIGGSCAADSSASRAQVCAGLRPSQNTAPAYSRPCIPQIWKPAPNRQSQHLAQPSNHVHCLDQCFEVAPASFVYPGTSCAAYASRSEKTSSVCEKPTFARSLSGSVCNAFIPAESVQEMRKSDTVVVGQHEPDRKHPRWYWYSRRTVRVNSRAVVRIRAKSEQVSIHSMHATHFYGLSSLADQAVTMNLFDRSYTPGDIRLLRQPFWDLRANAQNDCQRTMTAHCQSTSALFCDRIYVGDAREYSRDGGDSMLWCRLAAVSAAMDPREGSPKQLQFCPVRSPDGESCSRPIPYARKRCREHNEEYCALYSVYKDASAVVKDLQPYQISPRDIQSLWCAADVEDAMDRTEQFLKAIRTEIEGRELHEARFIDNVDDGHAAYLEGLRKKEKMRAALLVTLKARLHEIKTGTISYMTTAGASEERANVRRPFQKIQELFRHSEQQRRREEYIRRQEEEASWAAKRREEQIREENARTNEASRQAWADYERRLEEWRASVRAREQSDKRARAEAAERQKRISAQERYEYERRRRMNEAMADDKSGVCHCSLFKVISSLTHCLIPESIPFALVPDHIGGSIPLDLLTRYMDGTLRQSRRLSITVWTSSIHPVMDARAGYPIEAERCSARSLDGKFAQKMIQHASWNHCKAHRAECRTLYDAYKGASLQVKNLAHCQVLMAKKDLKSMQCADDVRRVLDSMREFLAAVRAEIVACEMYHARFVRIGACFVSGKTEKEIWVKNFQARFIMEAVSSFERSIPESNNLFSDSEAASLAADEDGPIQGQEDLVAESSVP
ncbi:hypothetical protein A0H81_12120 [Grifola frondosa]|uniref:Uncharacterized protein n=1 Tax=Grifola frondosa TaxID=5627 RepID=A0A1C7LVG0_GRIFR|nr:hypothetical protein A0H81_12120 [Grifola frondosa]